MDTEYRREFKILREKFRVLRDGIIYDILHPKNGNGTRIRNPMGELDGNEVNKSYASLCCNDQTISTADSQTIKLGCNIFQSRDIIARRSLNASNSLPCLPAYSSGLDVPRRPKKGHKKSRQGCFSCKKRRVKVCAYKPYDEPC
jgi:hypothetical protein